MTEDTTPENLRKFLESDDSAMVMMGLSMAKGTGIPEDLFPKILKMYMWDDDAKIRGTAKSVFNKFATEEAKSIVKTHWKSNLRTAKVPKYYDFIKILRGDGNIDLYPDYKKKMLNVITKMDRLDVIQNVLDTIDEMDNKSDFFLPLVKRALIIGTISNERARGNRERAIIKKFITWPEPNIKIIKKLAKFVISSSYYTQELAIELMKKYDQEKIVEVFENSIVSHRKVESNYEWDQKYSPKHISINVKNCPPSIKTYIKPLQKRTKIKYLKILFKGMKEIEKNEYDVLLEYFNQKIKKGPKESNDILNNLLSGYDELVNVETREYRLTMKDLKRELKNLGLKRTGLRNELFERLIEEIVD